MSQTHKIYVLQYNNVWHIHIPFQTIKHNLVNPKFKSYEIITSNVGRSGEHIHEFNTKRDTSWTLIYYARMNITHTHLRA